MRNLPNIITLSRLPLMVLFFAFFANASHDATLTFLSLAFLIAAGVTDALDGYLARKLKAESDFGRIIDPLLDKILICGGFTMLLGTEPVAAWMVVVILARELLVTALRAMIEAEGFKFGALMWGKVKMIVQWAAMVIVVLVEGYARAVPYREVSRLFPTIMVWVATIITALSAIAYVVEARHTLTEKWEADA